MVQSLKLGGAPNQDAENGIRRVNRLPLIIVVVLLIAFLAVIFYGLTTRGIFLRRDEGPGGGSGNPASTFADQLKRGVSDAIIGEPQQTLPLQPTPVEAKDEKGNSNPFAPQSESHQETQPTQELEDEKVWRARLKREQDEQYLRELQRQRMARLQANDLAYDAPISVDHGKFKDKGGESSDANVAATNSSSSTAANGGASDLYAAALRAGIGGQNLHPNAQKSGIR